MDDSCDILLETEDVSAMRFAYTLRYAPRDLVSEAEPSLDELTSFIALSDDMFTLFLEMSSSRIVLQDLNMAALEEMKARCARISNRIRRMYVCTLLGDILDDRVFLFPVGWETNEESFKDCIDMHQLSRAYYTAAADAILELPRGEQLQYADLIRHIPDSHPRKCLYLLGLACSLAQDKNQRGRDEVLSRSADLLDDIQRLHVFDATEILERLDYGSVVGWMSEVHHQRFARSSSVVDLDRAIDAADRCLQLTEGDVGFASQLAQLLAWRFQLIGDWDDVERALELTAKGQTSGNLSLRHGLLVLCYQHFRSKKYLDEVIVSFQEQKRLSPHTMDAASIRTHALLLLARFMDSRDDLELLEEVIRLTSGDVEPEGATDVLAFEFRYIQGSALRYRYYAKRDTEDLELAITTLSAGFAWAINESLPSAPMYLFSGLVQELADALCERAVHVDRPEDVHTAIAYLRNFVQSHLDSPFPGPYHLLLVALMWLKAASALPSSQEEASRATRYSALAAAMKLFPRIAGFGTSLLARQAALSQLWTPAISKDRRYGFDDTTLAHIPNLAVRVAIEQKDFAKAFEWLEQGRSVLWGQLLQLRIPLHDLAVVDADLAKEMSTVRQQLMTSSVQSSFVTSSPYEPSFDALGQTHRILTQQWEHCLDRARQLPGFESLLLPNKFFGGLLDLTVRNPVIVINTSPRGGDALIVMRDKYILHVPLPKITTAVAKQLVSTMRSALGGDFAFRAPSRAAHLAPFNGDGDPDRVLQGLLAFLWYNAVQPILQFMMQDPMQCVDIRPREDGAQTRVHWYTTGELALLPFHAAGDYTKDETGFRVYDYVISSYCTSLTSLNRNRPQPTRSPASEGIRILAVAASSSVGQLPLPATQDELSRIQYRAQNTPHCSFLALSEKACIASTVLEEMKASTWVHFACHGQQSLENPVESALLLSGQEKLKLSDIARVDLPDAELAFLSACQTAMGDDTLPAESLHLAAGMLLAGFRGVIATLWSIQDRDAPQVADDVYGYLLRERLGDGFGNSEDEAAIALHQAVGRLRDQVGETSFLSWVPWVHFGV
ncbi:hypothetical protein BDZ89DRAFT_170502 [Hymenopellis radicata]|nr:hypothetical protein BDZ89DRAFT_170502 [Hymenopellis radicata]